MKGRIYKTTVDGKSALVRATSRAQAFRFIANTKVSAELATQEDCVALAAGGIADANEIEKKPEGEQQGKEQKPEAKKEKKVRGSATPSSMKNGAKETANV